MTREIKLHLTIALAKLKALKTANYFLSAKELKIFIFLNLKMLHLWIKLVLRPLVIIVGYVIGDLDILTWT